MPYTDGVCGEAFDHSIKVMYEDEEILQWYCRNCGAEGWEDKSSTSPEP